jgi:hypothetical protein
LKHDEEEQRQDYYRKRDIDLPASRLIDQKDQDENEGAEFHQGVDEWLDASKSKHATNDDDEKPYLGESLHSGSTSAHRALERWENTLTTNQRPVF